MYRFRVGSFVLVRTVWPFLVIVTVGGQKGLYNHGHIVLVWIPVTDVLHQICDTCVL